MDPDGEPNFSASAVNRNSICCESPILQPFSQKEVKVTGDGTFVTGAFGGQIAVKPCGNIC